jgi:NAD(P)-dependent dehydrogenase (short-subunit alcohol dehydrogenase family)
VGITYCKNPEGAKRVQDECLKYGIEAKIYKADFQFREDSEKLMQEFLADFGTIDVLINNAGGALQIPKGEFDDMPMDYWDSQIALNLNACAYCAHAAVQNMKANGTQGRIVNVSSVHGSVTWVKRKMLPYCAAKAGLDMFTKSLGVEVARYGIRVNGIAPGLIMTKLADRYPPEQREAFQSKIPVEFLGQTEHIVPAIMFLSDIKSTEYIVGQVLTVDGGQSVSGTIPAMKESFER